MNIDRGLDLADKAAWHPDNADRIATQYGYAADGLFGQALNAYVETIVNPASVTDHLASVATRHFRSYEPPLTRLG